MRQPLRRLPPLVFCRGRDPGDQPFAGRAADPIGQGSRVPGRTGSRVEKPESMLFLSAAAGVADVAQSMPRQA
jgi:hypothetical protein